MCSCLFSQPLQTPHYKAMHSSWQCLQQEFTGFHSTKQWQCIQVAMSIYSQFSALQSNGNVSKLTMLTYSQFSTLPSNFDAFKSSMFTHSIFNFTKQWQCNQVDNVNNNKGSIHDGNGLIKVSEWNSNSIQAFNLDNFF